MGWAAGFQTGSRVAGDILDTIQQAREQRMIREAQQRRDEVVPLPFEMAPEPAPAAPPTGLGYVPQTSAQIERGDLPLMKQVTAADLGLVPAATPGGPARTSTMGEIAPRRYQSEVADIVALRNPLEAERMRQSAASEARAEEQYRYAVGRRPIAEEREALGLRRDVVTTTAAERALEREQRAEAGKTLLYARLKDNPNLTSADLGQIAAESGASIDAINQAYLNFNNVDEATYKRAVTQRVRELKKAGTDLPSLNKFLSSKLSALDPNPNDDIYPQVVQTKYGMQVMYGNAPLPGWGVYKNLDELVATAAFRLEGDVVGALKLTADLRKTEAQTEEDKARAGLLGAQAGRVREMPTEKGIAPEYVATLNDINVRMGEAQARGDTKEVQRLMGEYQRTQSIALSAIGKVMPLTIGVQAPPEMTKAQEDRYKELIKTDRWARLSPGQRAAELQAAGIPPAAAGIQSRGEAAEIYQQERPTPSKTAPPPSTAPAPAAAPARTREAQPNPYFNTRGERIANPPPGAPSLLESTVVPAVGLVAERVGQFATDSQRRYLQSKVAAGTASPGELIQARRLGLIQ